MNEILLHIDFLLRRFDCVTIPGVGALIATRLPAVIGDDAIAPPQRLLSFNPRINHNDGLLAGSIARREGLTPGEAADRLSAGIDQLYAALRHGEQPSVGRRGRLLFDAERGISFEPAGQWPLPELRLQPVLAMAREEAATEAALATGKRLARRLRPLRIAASVAVMLALGFVVSTPTAVGDGEFASPAVEQFTPKPASAPAAPSVITIAAASDGTARLSASPDDGCDASLKLSAVQKPLDDAGASQEAYAPSLASQRGGASQEAYAPSRATPNSSLLTPNSLRLEPTDSYCLVVASLANATEAERFIREADRPMAMLQSDGRYRVYVATGNSIRAVKAAAEAAGLTTHYPGAWVCRTAQ